MAWGTTSVSGWIREPHGMTSEHKKRDVVRVCWFERTVKAPYVKTPNEL